MIDFTFHTPSNILFRAGASGKIAGLLKGCKAARVLLVTDKNVRAAGLTRKAEAAIAEAGIKLTVFEDVVADPPEHVIETPADLCFERGCAAVLSIGGGSALDTAKLVAYLARNPDKLDDIYGVGLATGERLPLLLVPTTAGTGSEVTPIAIVTTPTNEKKAVVSPRLIADWVILDPELTLGLPRHVTAAAGIDAMVHAIEAYTGKINKNPISDQLALKAPAMLSDNLRKVCRDGSNLEARSEMLLGSMLAGMAFAHSPVAAVHGARLSDRRDLPCVARPLQCAGPALRVGIQPVGGPKHSMPSFPKLSIPAIAGSPTRRTLRPSSPRSRRSDATARCPARFRRSESAKAIFPSWRRTR